MDAPVRTVHIRRPTPSTHRTSSSGFVYRNPSGVTPTARTVCGADLTAYDMGRADAARTVRAKACSEFGLCLECALEAGVV